MGRDTIQPETSVSNISQKYLLEFTSEYGISEDLLPELSGPKERIVDFPEGKVGVYTKFFEFANFRLSIPQFLFDIFDMDLFNLICAPNPTKVKIGTRPRAAHEVPLLTVSASRVIEMEDSAATTEYFETPSTIERSPLDLANENPSQQSIGGDETKDQGQETVAPEVPPPENITTTRVAPETSLVGEIAAMGPRVIKKHRKRGNDGVDANAPRKVLRKDHADSRPTQSTVGGKSIASMGLETGSTFPVPTSQKTPADVIDPDPLSFAKPQSSKGATVAGDPESENTSFTSMQESTLQAQVTGEEKLKATFEEFKKYEDDWVEKRCAKMDARRDALSIDFGEELYPHMLTATAGRRWVIRHGLRLAVMKYGESRTEAEHGKANLDLEAIEAYDPEADTKYVEALHALRDLKYPVVDQLESLKDAPIDVIMASLHLDSDFGEDTP
nr:hypothetical protein [Tanacetum cinerariifolium]